ncbi:hypothetical protein GJ496_007365 [Pomphorhynchus laevis]|nr:hypothetical protein GJ496_007365 [Pomphorhynchus laevis]
MHAERGSGDKDILKCFCNSCTHEKCTISKGSGRCFAANELFHKSNSFVKAYGCLSKRQSNLLCSDENRIGSKYGHSLAIQCCSTNMCNKDMIPSLRADYSQLRWAYFIQNAVAICFIVILLTCFTVCVLIISKRRNIISHDVKVRTTSQSTTDVANKEIQLLQPCVSNQIQYCELLDRGRYSQVWKAVWLKRQPVVVKLIESNNLDIWTREVQSYRYLRHRNVLQFLFADILPDGHSLKYMIVTDFHWNQSLFHFLRINILNEMQMWSVLRSLCAGLAYLHSTIYVKIGSKLIKPRILHNDLKSKNILVMSKEGECCIADFGMSADEGSWSKEIQLVVSTKRYAAPERLISTSSFQSFADYLPSDVYSISLCLWECVNRTEFTIKDVVPIYTLPYENDLPVNPSVEEVLSAIHIKQARPVLQQHVPKLLREKLSALLEECWMDKSEQRITARLLERKIKELYEANNIIRSKNHHSSSF